MYLYIFLVITSKAREDWIFFISITLKLAYLLQNYSAMATPLTVPQFLKEYPWPTSICMCCSQEA